MHPKKISLLGLTLMVLLLPLHTKAKDLSADPNNLANVNACAGFSKENSTNRTFNYVLNGQESQINANMYPGLSKCLSKLKQKTSCPNCAHAKGEDQDDSLVINNVVQNDNLQELVNNIKAVTSEPNDQARVAVNLVQGFHYEDKDKSTYDYPYQVAFDKAGICNETAKLIVLLLKHLGFGAAMMTFEKDNHQAAGIKCDPKFSYQNTGYCFVEPTTRAIITDPVGEKSKVRVNQVSDGQTFDASKDYEDAKKYISFFKKKHLDQDQHSVFTDLQHHYGLKD